MLRLFADAPSQALRLAWRAIGLLIVANYLYAIAISAILAALLLAPDGTMSTLGVKEGVDRGPIYLGFRLLTLIGIAGAVLMHRVLKTLRAVVATVRERDPFVPENATRLEQLAKLFLGLELLHLAVGAVTAATSTPEQPLDVDWNFSFTPWLAVVLLFVLARVFREGTRMKAELDAVV